MDNPELPEWIKRPVQPILPPSNLIGQGLSNYAPAVPLPSVAEKSVVARLQENVAQANRILGRKPFPKSDALQWLRRVRTIVTSTFGADAMMAKDLESRIKQGARPGIEMVEMAHQLQGLQTLIDHLVNQGNSTLGCQISLPSRPPITKSVFIIHGHDELNTRRLSSMLQEEFNLEPIVILAKAGMSRPLTDKFEDEAQTCAFAFALFTPDDEVVKNDGSYSQARPNAIYEAGWFIGRLGKNRVALLLKQGTRIHSDLDGVSQIRFGDDITEKFLEIRKELQAASLA